MTTIGRALIGTAVVITAACEVATLASPEPQHGAPADRVAAAEATSRASHGIPHVGGEWVFSETISVLQPSELNAIIGGPEVEAPMTRVNCVAEGTMTLEQSGAAFEGTATQSVICRIGDVSFVPPEFAFNPEFFILNGRIHGHAIHFDTGHSLNTCPQRGSIRVDGNTAVALSAFGKCEVPFHPGVHNSWWTIRRP